MPLSSEEKLQERMRRLGINEADIEENFIRGTGPGGQKVNKTSSCVQLTHKPTGIMVRCQNERNQSQNRIAAKEELCNRIEARQQERKQSQAAAQSKARRQKAKRSWGTKQEVLRDKKHHAIKKKFRRSFDD
jgi:protein subunit release factor B